MDPSTSNPITFNKLTAATFQDFDDWRFSIQCLLIDCDLWDVCTKEVNAEDADEKKKDEKARAKIGQACDVSVFPIIRPAKTAYEMINRLKAHAHGGLKKRLSLIKKLLSIQYNGNVQEYVKQSLDTQEELEGIGAPVDDGFLAMFMLSGLPEGFEPLVRRLDAPEVQMTSEIVAKELLKEGNRAVPGTSGSQQTKSQPPKHTCEKCHQTFATITGLRRHVTNSKAKGDCSRKNARESAAASASPPKRAKRTVQPAPGPSSAPAPMAPPPAAPPLRQTHKICSLVPFMNLQWTIKARVMEKSPIQCYVKKKKHGGGKANYFTMDLRDESGVIRAVAFEGEVDRFYNMIQVGKHYYISRGQVKKTKKKYKQVNNDNELTLSNNTLVAECCA